MIKNKISLLFVFGNSTTTKRASTNLAVELSLGFSEDTGMLLDVLLLDLRQPVVLR
jgi:hypothetical protein